MLLTLKIMHTKHQYLLIAESSPPYLEDAMIDLEEETTNLEDTTLTATPQSAMGSNEVNDPPVALAQFNMSKTKSGNTLEISNNFKA